MKRDDIFERLDPPPNGLAALRERLDAKPRPLRVIVPAAAAIAIAAALAIILVGRHGAVDITALAREHGGPSEISLGLAKPPDAPVTLARDQQATTALSVVPSADRRVAFYWVSSTQWEP